MKILITGASGLVGSALVKALAGDGHMVCRLVRPETKTAGGAPGAFDVAWNPETGELGGAAVGAEAGGDLGGASIAGGRWAGARQHTPRTRRGDITPTLVIRPAKINAEPR